MAAMGYPPLYGPWPPPGIKPIPVADIQTAVHAEITGYWRRISRKREQLIGGGLADLRQLVRGERLEVLELLVLGRLVVLADPVQPRLALLRRHRIRTRPRGNIIPPRVRRNRFRRHVPPPVRHDVLYRT
jgi:hypothetical protein